MTQAFNLSQLANLVNTSGQLNAATGLFNQTPVANGGTGLSTVTSGAILLGAGTSAMTVLAGTTPGTVIGSSPTGWSAVPNTSVGGGNYIMRTYTSPSPWVAPAALKAVKVTVIGAGGNGGSATTSGPTAVPSKGGGGGSGAFAQTYYNAPAVSPLTITAGAGTNSFGALVSCTAGSNGGNGTNATFGTGGAGGAVTPSPTIQIAINGFSGAPGDAPAASGNTNSNSGGGANTFMGFGFGGNGQPFPGNAVGANANGYGAGGAGGTRGPGVAPVQGTTGGGNGVPGVIIVEEFY